VHDVGTEGRLDYLVMEYVAGRPLDRLIPRNGLKLKEALQYAIQIADALKCAHAAGIIHRDLKPANVLIDESGVAKVVDFGIAKQVRTGPDSHTLTHEGLILGTVAYMSPEQAEGKPVDGRSDIFSFGSLLYELVTGRRAFQGDTTASTLAAVIRDEPEPASALADDLPLQLVNVVERCLRKNPAERFQTIGEVGAALRAGQEDLSAARRLYASAQTTDANRAKAEIKTHPRRRRWVLVIAGCAAGLVLAIVARHFTTHEPLQIPKLKQQRLTSSSSENPVTGGAAISPDGRYLAYSDRNGMHVKLLETGETQTIPQPEDVGDGRKVSWSIGPWFPTGTRFLLNSHSTGQEEGLVWIASVLGGPPRKLRDSAKAFSVSPDGSWIAFGTHLGGHAGYHEIWLIRPNGEQAHKLLESGEKADMCCLQGSAGGRRVIYLKSDEFGDSLISRDLSGGPARTVVSFPPWRLRDYRWLPDGRVLYVLGDSASGDTCNFWQIRVNPQTSELTDPPKQLTNWAGFCMSELSATADGKRLTFLRSAGRSSIYIAGLEAGARRIKNPSRLTQSDSFDAPLDWTNDSKTVIFLSNRDGQWAVFKQGRDAETAEPLVVRAERVTNARLSPDGAWVLYGIPANDGRATTRLNRMPIAGGPSEWVLSDEIDDHFCAKSPAKLCVIATLRNNQLIFSALDIFKGSGRELARFDINPKASYANNNWYFWDLSPEGTRVAILRQGESQIHVLPLNGQPPQDISVKDWDTLRGIHWAASGKGFFVSSQVPRAAVLLYVDLEGNSQVLWKQEGGLATYATPSPDGHYLAISRRTADKNVWMLEDF